MKISAGSKAISPILAAVFLLVLTLSIAGFLGKWMLEYWEKLGKKEREKIESERICRFGKIGLREVKANLTSNQIIARIENKGNIALGNLTLYLINKTSVEKIVLNFSLEPEAERFIEIVPQMNVSTLELIKLTTNCSKVWDEVEKEVISYIA